MAGLSLHISPTLAIAAFCVSSFGIAGALPVFWNLPTAFLGSAAAAAGIAFINSVGGVAGYAAPQLVGILRDATGSYELPMVVIGMAVIAAGLLVPLSTRRSASTRRWVEKIDVKL
jgi:nitrate/nitrite transporter NarK